jgi:lipopolysaccharide/colanic/teichoic acid biosynthesis glycosyltransferase
MSLISSLGLLFYLLQLTTPMHDLLLKCEFLSRLRIEKRRVDRSKLPLSVVLLSFRDGALGERLPTPQFLKLLQKNTRETDIKGWVDSSVIGLILPDTNEKGVQILVNKILNCNGDKPYSVMVGTYPDDLFHQLLNGDEEQPDLSPIALDEFFEPRKFQKNFKRIMDIMGSVIGLMVCSPLMVITAIAVKLTSPGPIIFKQYRLGKKGIRFRFYKFRSMYWNADDQIHREYVTNLIEGDLDKINQGDAEEPLYKMKSDQRVTPVGKIIRRANIDELPQFINVLKGEMSLVGPRPPLPYEVEKYKPWHLRRIFEVQPGITGLWQVDGRSRTSFDDMVRMDLKYAQNWSLWLDIKILLKTVREVIWPKGAL